MAWVKATKDMVLTPTQENIINALFMLDGDREMSGGEWLTSFSGRAVATVIGGGWSTFRARSCNDLEQRGWIRIEHVGKLVYYSLTAGGKSVIRDRLHRAKQGAREYRRYVETASF